MQIVYREGNYFKIDKKLLPKKSQTLEVINGLYAAIYDEFKGAVDNPKYQNLSYFEKMNKLNEFAEDWLRKRNLLNG
jgi:hypothetical protein